MSFWVAYLSGLLGFLPIDKQVVSILKTKIYFVLGSKHTYYFLLHYNRNCNITLCDIKATNRHANVDAVIDDVIAANRMHVDRVILQTIQFKCLCDGNVSVSKCIGSPATVMGHYIYDYIKNSLLGPAIIEELVERVCLLMHDLTYLLNSDIIGITAEVILQVDLDDCVAELWHFGFSM